jgi:hypothetical protein
MKRSALFSFVLTGMVAMAMQRADASSAVAMDPDGHLTRAYDPTATEGEAKQGLWNWLCTTGGLAPGL